jgi:hypothetical protein
MLLYASFLFLSIFFRFPPIPRPFPPVVPTGRSVRSLQLARCAVLAPKLTKVTLPLIITLFSLSPALASAPPWDLAEHDRSAGHVRRDELGTNLENSIALLRSHSCRPGPSCCRQEGGH